MKLYLVRHGETDWNKVKKIQGQVDIPLNQFGKHLAEETAEGLHDIPFDLCISSPLSRAYETARIILEGRDVPIITDARIGEMAFGEYEGKYWGIGVHSNCAVTEVEVKNAEAKILSENVTYYKETVRPWAGN